MDGEAEEQTMIDTQRIERHTDGAINFDFYRARASKLRREAKRNAYARRPGLVRTIAAVGMTGLVCLVMFSTARPPHAVANVPAAAHLIR
jgi:hypothetical protein